MKSHDLFADATFAQEWAERSAVGVTFVGDVHRLGRRVAQSGVECGENGAEGFDKLASGRIDHRSIGIHERFEHIKQPFVERAFLFEQGVALLQSLAVANERL